MFRSIFPPIASVASPWRTGWTASDGPSSSASPTSSQIPISRLGRCRQTRNPTTSLDVGSEIDGSDSRTGHELRLHLCKLQEEAESTRSKANSARMRLVRLSEVAEQLQTQAASKVRAGKEDDAREMLFQKKKVMLALEKSRNRIELLDQLSAKLNEAILLKESELIGNVSSQLSVSTESMDSPILVVPPRMVSDEELKESGTCEPPDRDSGSVQIMEPQNDQASNCIRNLESRFEENPTAGKTKTDMDTFTGISTYESFLKDMDGRLEGIQHDLAAFLRLSNRGTRNDLRQKSEHLQDLQGILHDVSGLRKRIERIIPTQSDEA